MKIDLDDNEKVAWSVAWHNFKADDQDHERRIAVNYFLAGIAFSGKPHVVADGDLPNGGIVVVAELEGNKGFALVHPEVENPERTERFFSQYVKHWWTLPEVLK